MTLLQITTEDKPDLGALLPGQRVTVMLHGMTFSHLTRATDPRTHIYARRRTHRDPKAVPWPHHLGLGRPQAGAFIGYCWDGTGGLRRAYGRAGAAAEPLAALIGRVSERTGQPVDIFAHSLGARVALQALAHCSAGSVGTMILHAAAEYQSATQEALPQHDGPQIINVMSRENDLFDALFELGLRPLHRRDRALGCGLGQNHHGWHDLQLDCPATLAALGHAGFRIAPPQMMISHWSTYLRPGAFRLYRAVLQNRLSAAQLPRAALRPRWSGHWSGAQQGKATA